MSYRRSLIPGLRVHIWGGLGSQLFGAIVVLRLKRIYPNRRIKACFHTSGVTERLIELPEGVLKHFEYFQYFDYSDRHTSKVASPHKSLRHRIFNSTKRILVGIGIIAELNSEAALPRLRTYLLSVRGHYTGIKLEFDEIEWLYQELTKDFALHKTTARENQVMIHFRLGDLLTLDSKTYVNPRRLAECFTQISGKPIPCIITDTPIQKVYSLISDFKDFTLCEIRQLDVIQVIRAGSTSMHFIGTNSKISLWIAIFRSAFGVPGQTYLPEELIPVYLKLMAGIENRHPVYSYRQ